MIQATRMAPFMGPDREHVLKLLRGMFPKRHAPITLGRHSPQAEIDVVDGRWVLTPLELDQDAATKAGEEAIAAGRNWMPEMEWQFLRRGAPIHDADSARELAALLEDASWSWS